jgi:hypothetical protein
MLKLGSGKDRRRKRRFAMERELRFKILESDRVTMTGAGQTIDMSSGGVAFEATTRLRSSVVPGTVLELSISWPVLLHETCLMRLVVFGHLVRTRQKVMVCSIDRYEFRTQARETPPQTTPPLEGQFRRWIGTPVWEGKATARAAG